jgi:hypothetical protein
VDARVAPRQALIGTRGVSEDACMDTDTDARTADARIAA